MPRFFEDCKTLEELKRAYHAAAMMYHPDRGGDTETMKTINAEYEARFQTLKHIQNTQAAEDTTGQTHATTETAEDFIGIINFLLHLEGLEVELCGRWLWIGGNTKSHKEKLKSVGCRWSHAKKLWSWHYAEDGDIWHRGRKSMEQIREKYGSTRFSAGSTGCAKLTTE